MYILVHCSVQWQTIKYNVIVSSNLALLRCFTLSYAKYVTTVSIEPRKSTNGCDLHHFHRVPRSICYIRFANLSFSHICV